MIAPEAVSPCGPGDTPVDSLMTYPGASHAGPLTDARRDANAREVQTARAGSFGQQRVPGRSARGYRSLRPLSPPGDCDDRTGYSWWGPVSTRSARRSSPASGLKPTERRRRRPGAWRGFSLTAGGGERTACRRSAASGEENGKRRPHPGRAPPEPPRLEPERPDPGNRGRVEPGVARGLGHLDRVDRSRLGDPDAERRRPLDPRVPESDRVATVSSPPSTRGRTTAPSPTHPPRRRRAAAAAGIRRVLIRPLRLRSRRSGP